MLTRKPGDTVDVVVQRDGDRETVKVELGTRPDEQRSSRSNRSSRDDLRSRRQRRDTGRAPPAGPGGRRGAARQPAAREAHDALESALFEIKRVIVGQEAMLERVIVALLAGGHVLLEGVPGLAKTLTVKTVSDVLGGSFKRLQFTPDLVPADLVGTRIYRADTGGFDTELGPVFCNFLLADEINRAPAKVQSALLEVMQERQVTIGHDSHRVPQPFLVMATQNPIESEGTYALPEAQVDRFMFKLVVDYPERATRSPWSSARWTQARACARCSRRRRSPPTSARRPTPTWTGG